MVNASHFKLCVKFPVCMEFFNNSLNCPVYAYSEFNGFYNESLRVYGVHGISQCTWNLTVCMGFIIACLRQRANHNCQSQSCKTWIFCLFIAWYCMIKKVMQTMFQRKVSWEMTFPIKHLQFCSLMHFSESV